MLLNGGLLRRMMGQDVRPQMRATPVSTKGLSSLAPLITETAKDIGIDPVDLATAISYETAGTFNPTKAGPRTKWGRHRGLIQFGEPQARQYGVDWSNPINSQLGAGKAVSQYLKDAGVRPGMGMLDVYSAINAGRVGRYGASDAKAGGAPGTVADKVNGQMAGHRAKALALLRANGPQTASTLPAAPVMASPSRAPVAPSQGLPVPIPAAAPPFNMGGGILDLLPRGNGQRMSAYDRMLANSLERGRTSPEEYRNMTQRRGGSIPPAVAGGVEPPPVAPPPAPMPQMGMQPGLSSPPVPPPSGGAVQSRMLPAPPPADMNALIAELQQTQEPGRRAVLQRTLQEMIQRGPR